MSNRDALFYALKEIDGSLFILHVMIIELSRQTGKTNEMIEMLEVLTETMNEMKKERGEGDESDPKTSIDGMANFYVGMERTIKRLKNSINRASKSIREENSATSTSTVAEG